jgi:hypothetical protein
MNTKDKKDKTGDRLVASIRKTRAGAAGKTAAGAAAAPASERRAPQTRAAGAKEQAVQEAYSRDSYQYGRRVWPD